MRSRQSFYSFYSFYSSHRLLIQEVVWALTLREVAVTSWMRRFFLTS